MATQHPLTFLTAVALAASAVAQSGWTQRLPANQPSVRAYNALTFDLQRGTTVTFGGWNGGPIGQTWEWAGVNWIQRTTANSPTARCCNGLATDFGRGRVVLFGGTNASSSGDLDDTWEYDGVDWVRIHPLNRPSPRRFARMEYDAARARIVLFGGGAAGYASVFGDTWTWDGGNWTLRNPATSPPPRWAHGMAYDFALARVVMFGGTLFNTSFLLADTWAWDGANWTPVPMAVVPPAAGGHGQAYDATRRLTVRFGGLPNGAETRLLDDNVWRRDPRALAPPPRAWCALSHDLLRGRTVLFGGLGSPFGGYLGDTWEYDPGIVAMWTPFGVGCAGTAGVPALQPDGASRPIVGSTFDLELLSVPGSIAAISIGFSDQQWSGNTLPWNLSAIGMTGCALHSSPNFVFFTPATAGRATLSWPLPNNAGLIGTRFFDQGFVLDPGSNTLGAVVSNAGAGIIGPF